MLAHRTSSSFVLGVTRLQAFLPCPLARLSTTQKDSGVVLNESDLEETFIHGWGPGGQAINKTANCVFLKHLPTGLSVKCQDGRDLQLNRAIARKRLQQRLDEYFKGSESDIARKRRELQAKENNRYSRAKRRLEMKSAFKEAIRSRSIFPDGDNISK
ncbi:unnamed protein product [Mesocestoides corti]|uniref:RF_PROK_I domain-containing protein n=1 Tax=Mesocestoides corti TaxID=53468 RepID=A0A0R3UR19_MESCO|nr:unnamed protein product [Mesocestoides corti]